MNSDIVAKLPRTNILGVGISAITMDDALTQISGWLESGRREYVSVCTVHTVMECYQQKTMRDAVNNAGMATPDGMPLVWLGKRAGLGSVSRVYGPDLMLHLCQLSALRGYTQYFYGGADGIPEKLARNLQARFPELKVAGAYSPPFRELTMAEDEEIIDRINKAKPDVVWVGLGTPKQDLWMASHRRKIHAPVLIGVGAAFDFHTGQVRQAPRWMQQAGLEWFFRLLMEPRRLWRRYLLYNPWFLWLVFLQQTGLRKFSLEIATDSKGS